MPSSVDVHRAAHDAFNGRDWDAMRSLTDDAMTAADHARGAQLRGYGEFQGWLEEWVAGMSDARVADATYLDAGDWSVARFRGRGTNDGTLGPARATGKSIDLAFCELVRVADGKIVEQEIFYDAMTMMAQLGVVQPPVAA